MLQILIQDKDAVLAKHNYYRKLVSEGKAKAVGGNLPAATDIKPLASKFPIFIGFFVIFFANQVWDKDLEKGALHWTKHCPPNKSAKTAHDSSEARYFIILCKSEF